MRSQQPDPVKSHASHFTPIDISLPLHSDMPVWPNSASLRLTRTMRLEAGDSANVSRLDCGVHVGTHVDAPRHFIENGNTVEHLSLDALIGPALVAHLPDVNAITADDLTNLYLPQDSERLLLRTSNSDLWTAGVTEFREDYVGLTPDAARWIVDREIRLIGTDYLGIHRWGDGPPVHQILLGADVIIVEGLNLAGVEPGEYELICLPLKLVGAEGAPARAVLVKSEE